MTADAQALLNWAAFGFFALGSLGGVCVIVARVVRGPCVRRIELIEDDDKCADSGDPRLIPPASRREWWD